MFKLKLTALGHPNPDGFNCNGNYLFILLCQPQQKCFVNITPS